MFDADLLSDVRGRFAHIDTCPFQGKRIYFENAGGALTLHSVVQSTATMAAMPDNLGRDNPAARALADVIAAGRADMRLFFGARHGEVIVGESGTELLFRLIRTAACAGSPGGQILGSTLEHPASRSAAGFWSRQTGAEHVLIAHDNQHGSVAALDYQKLLTTQTRVATIVHTSPVTGMSVDIDAIARVIRTVSPQCFIIVDGIQHAAHGALDLADCDIDAYVISPYKVFSRHGYGVAWLSDRLARCAHEKLLGSPATQWELGTRDVGAFSTFSAVVDYFAWLGARCAGDQPEPPNRRASLRIAGRAIHAQEAHLTNLLLQGRDDLKGLAGLPGVSVIGGVDNPLREGLVSFTVAGHESGDVVRYLGSRGVRTHVRKNDHYSGNVLGPLSLPDCVRVSLCHYNSSDEVQAMLLVMTELIGR